MLLTLQMIVAYTHDMDVMEVTLSMYLAKARSHMRSLKDSTELAGGPVMRKPTSHGNDGDNIVPVVHEGPDPDGGSHGPNQHNLRSMTEARAEHAAECSADSLLSSS